MKAAILAAGIGSRLWPLTSNQPKSMVKVRGKQIIDYQIDAYVEAGISEIYIVGGFEIGKLKTHLRHRKDVTITFVENVDFENTNNLFSLSLLSEYLRGENFILNNADLVIETKIVTALHRDIRQNLVAVDNSLFLEESMKITADEGIVTGISKTISEHDSAGCSIDFYKFSAESSELLFEMLEKQIVSGEAKNIWTEVLLDRLFSSNDLVMEVLDVSGLKWVEVDNHEDLLYAEKIFGPSPNSLAEIQKVFIDLDGTLLVGGTMIPGANEAVQYLRNIGKEVYFLTNNSSKSKADISEWLNSKKISALPESIIQSTDGLISFLLQQKNATVYPVGTRKFLEALTAAGIQLGENNVDYVAVGYDTELTYGKLSKACELIHAGAEILATHTDIYCPSEKGPIPDIGTTLDTLHSVTGQRPSHVFGKPNVSMISHKIEGQHPEKILIIGDRIYTDQALAIEGGFKFALVLTGESTISDIQEMTTLPDFSLGTISDLIQK